MPPTDTQRAIARRLAAASGEQLLDALFDIAESAMDDDQSGNDTADVVYTVLGRLGITVP